MRVNILKLIFNAGMSVFSVELHRSCYSKLKYLMTVNSNFLSISLMKTLSIQIGMVMFDETNPAF